MVKKAGPRGSTDRNAGVAPDRTSRPGRPPQPRIGGGGGTRPSSKSDDAAAREAGVTRDRQMKESERHTVVGKGKATRKA